ncbi:hypothetical protein [Niveibacterium terrae]|uniref:hypothetical protein n=1 Tax=Niveibacterium terrae TaxID=3373598 RepID=UPI003A91AB92
MKLSNFSAALAVCLVAGSVQARSEEKTCVPEVYEAVMTDLKTVELSSGEGGNVVSESCKIWPYDERFILAALAYDAGEEYEKQLVVAVIDRKSWRVSSHYKKTVDEDAATEFGAGSLRIDTARYQLADGVRAFAVRFDSSSMGPSCGEASWSDELTLFVPEGKQLRPVLNLAMNKQKSFSGCLSTESSNAVWENAKLTIGVGTTRTNGLSDLQVTAKITADSNGPRLGKHKNRTEQQVFHYDGKVYRGEKNVPWWLEY